MKKILLVTLEHPPQIGGIATYCHDLALALDHDKVVVLAAGGNDKFAGQKEKLAWDAAQPYSIIRKKLLFPKFIWPRWLLLCWQIWRAVKKHNIEIIFVQHVLPVGYAAILMKKFLHVPFLLFSHGTDLVAGTATAWKRKMITMVSREAEQIIFNSESLKRRYLRVLPQFGEISTVLYPCPDKTFLEPPTKEALNKIRTQYALEGKRVILTVSRLDEGKGFPHLIHLLPTLLKENPNMVWLLVGDGPKKHEFIKMIQKNNLQNVVRFVGEMPHDKLRVFYYTADLFVLLTHPDEGREEGLGLVFLEASAAGLPIVAGRSGGVEEAVIDGQTGVVVDAYNGTQVMQSVLELLRNPVRARELGQRAKERIRTDFRWEEQVKKLDKWID